MIYQLIKKLDHRWSFDHVQAHCDIPCGIYDPISAQLAALTVVRTVDLLNDNTEQESGLPTDYAQYARLVAEKEAHGIKVKDEVRIIWGDYFKPKHFEDMPELERLCHDIMRAASRAKQHVSRDAAIDMLDLVNQFAEAFWKTKGVETFVAKCPYAPNEDVVYPQLS